MAEKVILIVDDELAIHACLADALAEAGYRVQMAQRDQEARERAARSRPNVVLLADPLEGKDAGALARHFRTVRLSSVVLLDPPGSPAPRAVRIADGSPERLPKPLEHKFLFKVLERVLAERDPFPDRVIYVLDRVCFFPSEGCVCLNGAPVELSEIQLRLLVALVSSNRCCVGQARLESEIWHKIGVTPNAVGSMLSRLRDILEAGTLWDLHYCKGGPCRLATRPGCGHVGIRQDLPPCEREQQ